MRCERRPLCRSPCSANFAIAALEAIVTGRVRRCAASGGCGTIVVMVDALVLAERLARFRAREERARSVRSHGNDVRATAALAVDATQGVMDVVRDMQRAFSPPVIAEFSALVHAAVRGVTGIVGAGVDVTLAALAPALGASAPGMEREAVLAALNGVVGDRPIAASNCAFFVSAPKALVKPFWLLPVS